MSTCPTCGQAVQRPLTRRERQTALLSFLAIPIKYRPANLPRQRRFDTVRDIYMSGGDPREWYLTYGNELAGAEEITPFSRDEVLQLVEAGTLVPTFPGTEAEKHSFRLTPPVL